MKEVTGHHVAYAALQVCCLSHFSKQINLCVLPRPTSLFVASNRGHLRCTMPTSSPLPSSTTASPSLRINQIAFGLKRPLHT